MQQKTFLLADDDMDDRDLFGEALQRIDRTIICHVATDGRETLKILDGLDALPHLIFLDVNMPVMDGWHCLKKLKEDERFSAIPVVIISTSSHQREIAIARDLDAFCYFTKPHQFSELIQVLRVMIGNTGASLLQALRDLDGEVSRYVHLLRD